jgi:hypothetical protein
MECGQLRWYSDGLRTGGPGSILGSGVRVRVTLRLTVGQSVCLCAAPQMGLGSARFPILRNFQTDSGTHTDSYPMAIGDHAWR